MPQALPFVGPAIGLIGAFKKSSAEKRLSGFTPTGFRAPGLSANISGGGITLNRGSGVDQALSGLTSAFSSRSAEFRGLRGRVAPGVGDLTQARVRGIRDTASRTVGNLREELSKRRVLGSSFAQREIASTEAMFGREEERARAEGALTEIALTQELIAQEFDGAIQAAKSVIDQFNFETTVATNLANQATTAMAATTTAAAQASAARQGGAAELIGTLAGIFSDELKDVVKGIFE